MQTGNSTSSSPVWLAGVRRCESPNYNERPAGETISLLVIHNISLPPGEFDTPAVEQFFCNRLPADAHPYFASIAHMQVSAHLFVRRSGEVIQFVPLDKRAWHAGVSCFEGRENCNDYSIGIELEGTDECPYTQAQYQALAELTRQIQHHFPAISCDRITGHCNIAPGRKTDPGPAFRWDYFRALLTNKEEKEG